MVANAKSIKPIETEYSGVRFRSRLEARWAVFFDALGISWEYEPEGFELPSGRRYLPDFRLRWPGEEHLIYYAEVKPPGYVCGSGSRMQEFSNATGRHMFILDGCPGLKAYRLLTAYDDAHPEFNSQVASFVHEGRGPLRFYIGESFGLTEIVINNPQWGEAVLAAKGYRFWG